MVWLASHTMNAALAVAWPVPALFGAALVLCVALAFRAFDVGRDTPE
jgi:hypothetical protein